MGYYYYCTEEVNKDWLPLPLSPMPHISGYRFSGISPGGVNHWQDHPRIRLFSVPSWPDHQGIQTTNGLLFILDFDLCYVNVDIFWMFVLYSCITFKIGHGNQYVSIFVDCSDSCFSRNVEDMHGWYLLCQALVSEYCLQNKCKYTHL